MTAESPAMDAAPAPPRGLRGHADFARLWTAKIVSDFGSQLGALALTALLTLGASPAEMGALAAAGGLPVLAGGLVAGVWVDRLRRRPLLIAADTGRLLLLASVPLAWAFGALTMVQLYVVAAAAGTLTVLFDVADPAYLPTLVPRDLLIVANSRLAAGTEIAEITAPGAGGALAQALGAPIAVAIDALTFGVSALAIGLIRTPEPPPAPAAGPTSVGAEIRAGLRVVFADPALRALAAARATASFSGNFIGALYAIYLIRDLGLPPVVMGLSIGMGGVGAIGGTFVADRLARRFGLGPALIGSQVWSAVIALSVPLAGGAPGPWAAAAILFAGQLLGDVGWQINAIADVTLRQTLVPPALLGRANASLHVTAAGLAPIGALVAGVLAEAIGVRGTLWIAVAGLLVAPLWLIASPLRGLREAPPPPDAG